MDNVLNKTVVFRVPPLLANAMATAASNDLLSVSDVIRLALVKDLRQRGLMPAASAGRQRG
jgi:hypothetical protein